VSKFVSMSMAIVVAVLLNAAPAMAQEDQGAAAGQPAVMQSANAWTLVNLSGAFGCGLVVIGAAYGIGRLAGSALESMARQPEVAGNIQVAMIIAAALIEGFTFYALFICSQQNPFTLLNP
jgi:F-type H+-transporting ATPase subunit c